MNNIKEIVVDPRCKFNYASWYLYGLDQCGIKWHFGDVSSFDAIMINHLDYTRGFGMLIKNDQDQVRKVYLDVHDDNDIMDNAYDWCDVYATVNIREDLLKPKILPIGPSCGLNIYGPMRLLYLIVSNCIKIYPRKLVYKPNFKELLHDYLYSIYRRESYSQYYQEVGTEEGYCFAISTLWADALADQETNTKRYWFIKVCSQLFDKFEGGFFFNEAETKRWAAYSSYIDKFEGLLYKQRIPLKEYIEKTKKSMVVFNTPAVGLCLGWKLAEYLMMGKAIISTTIGNVMPGDFIPGIHYLLANNEAEIKQCVTLINKDSALRLKLEKNAKEYFEEYLAPQKVVGIIIEMAYSK